MRNYDGATTAYLSGPGMHARVLVWIEARDPADNSLAAIGFWNGDDHQEFTIGGETRLYYGAGGLMQVPAITYGDGLAVRSHSFGLAITSDEVAQALRGYDVRFAPVEVHRAFFDLDTGNLIAPPHRVLNGSVDEVSIPTPEIGGQAMATISVVSSALDLTRTQPVFRSDADQSRRSGDRFLKYAAAKAKTSWGEA